MKAYGVTFDKICGELEKCISHGYHPYFGYPALKFNSVIEALAAMTYEDSSGYPNPIMSRLNKDQIKKLHNNLL